MTQPLQSKLSVGYIGLLHCNMAVQCAMGMYEANFKLHIPHLHFFDNFLIFPSWMCVSK
jgi:hypothetical protein